MAPLLHGFVVLERRLLVGEFATFTIEHSAAVGSTVLFDGGVGHGHRRFSVGVDSAALHGGVLLKAAVLAAHGEADSRVMRPECFARMIGDQAAAFTVVGEARGIAVAEGQSVKQNVVRAIENMRITIGSVCPASIGNGESVRPLR